jgi:hypothetical protein
MIMIYVLIMLRFSTTLVSISNMYNMKLYLNFRRNYNWFWDNAKSDVDVDGTSFILHISRILGDPAILAHQTS